MIRLLPILALLTGCGLADRLAKRDALPPGDRIVLPAESAPGMMEPDPPCEFPAIPPSGDYNGDGGVDGADVEAFWCDWADGIRFADLNMDGICDKCDVWVFVVAWEQGA